MIRSAGLVACLILAQSAWADPAMVVGHVDMDLNGPGLGGFSGIEILGDGDRALVLSDRAWLVDLTLIRSDDGTLRGVEAGAVRALENAANPNRPGDSEGLALTARGPVISYEGDMRIARHSLDGSERDRLPPVPDASNLPENAGLEGLAIDTDGRLYTAAEGPRGGAATPIWRLEGDSWSQIASLPRRDGFSVVGLDVGPDGRLYVLERGLTIFAEFKSRLSRYDLTEDGLGPQLPLWDSGPGLYGNLEGVSVWQTGGRLIATLISDDNFSPFFRAEIVELGLPD